MVGQGELVSLIPLFDFFCGTIMLKILFSYKSGNNYFSYRFLSQDKYQRYNKDENNDKRSEIH